MALLLLNNAEETASGTTVTTANSSGTNDNAFQGVTIGANMGLTFDNAHAAHGTNGFKWATSTTSTHITYLEWSGFTAATRIYGAFYVYITASIASSVRLIQFRNGTSTLNCGIFLDSSTNKIGIRSSADAALATTSTAMALNTWMRVEFDFTFNATTGAGTVTLYTGDSTTPNSTVSVSAQNFGTQCDHIRVGCCTANFSSVNGAAFWLDDLNFNDTGVPGPGPYSASGPQTVSTVGLGTAQSFGTPTTAEGGVSVSVAGLGSSQAFGKISLKIGVFGLGSAQQFGLVSLKYQVPSLASAARFGAPLGVGIQVPSLGSAAAFGAVSASTTGGGQAVNPTGLSTAQLFGTPTIHAAITVAVSGLGSAQAFGSPQENMRVFLAGLGSAQAFGAPTPLTGNVNVPVNGLSTAQVFGAPSVTTPGGGPAFSPAIHGGNRRRNP